MSTFSEYQGLAFVGIGSNIGDSAGQVQHAMELLGGIVSTEVTARSSLYRSAPFGPVKQPDYVNAVVSLRTRLAARALLSALQDIERSQGRRRTVRWGPRTLDLDLLTFGDQTSEDPVLTLPHPGIAERNFVLLPLREIAPKLVIPGIGPVSDIAVNEQEPRISRIS